GADIRFDIVQFQEYIPLGQRVSGWKVDVKVGDEWKEFANGSTIGYKRIVQAKEVQASAVRLTITGSLAVPLINSLSVFRAHEDLIESDLPPAAGVDGQFVMEKEYITAKETDGTVSVKVKLEDRSNKEVSVYVATVPGTGVQGKVYQDKTATLKFPAGVNEQEFVVNLINNQNNEGGKDFYIQISNPLGGDVTIGEPSSVRVWVEDDENPMAERTVTVVSGDNTKGSVKILVPETTESSITTSFPVMVKATPASGYKFIQWENALTQEVVSTESSFTYDDAAAINLIARFDEAYIVMTRTFTNGISQQNRYLKKVTTTGTNTPTVFSASSQSELPYTSFPSSSIGKYIEAGACIDKRENPISIDFGTTSFNITFYGYTSSISGYSSELNWTQQAIFIDWGKDGSFNESGDIYPKSSDDIGNSSTVCSQFISSSGYTRTISVPANQPAGKYRMRVVYYEPESNSNQWQNSIMTSSGKGQIRNGISYDFEIEIVSTTVPSRTITVSANPAEGGTVSGGGSGEEPIAISAVANEGYQFLYWSVNGNIVSYEATYTDSSEGDKEYVANFRLIPTYNVSVDVNDILMGIASVNGGNADVKTLEGNTVTLSATANDGYKFAGWRLNGNLVSSSNPYIATITSESEFVAIFEEGGAEYFTNFGNSTRSDRSRNLSNFSFSDGTNSKTVSVNQSANSGAAIYYDKTSEVVTLEP
ncbi:MAG: InlB B-repeat-containing protein, partial [Muribaculaceae bacterium]|nr:InlB B-repeat-containing protein [Muribaculaceae bacterium]